MKKALILVDLQNDYCAGGMLETGGAGEVVAVANRLMPGFDLVVATQDWHPADHGSFAANHPWRKPGQVIDLNGQPQKLWPIHCVQESFGAEFPMGLNTTGIHRVIRKGTDPGIGSYSAFFDQGRRKNTGLADLLKEAGIQTIYVMGLGKDHSVENTVSDALSLGFNTMLILDACPVVYLEEEDGEKRVKDLRQRGAEVIDSRQIEREITK